MSRPQILLAMDDPTYAQLFDAARLARLNEVATLGDPARATTFDDAAVVARLSEVEVLLTGWGSPMVDASVLDRAPRLRAVVHAAGSVKPHLDPVCWERGLVVTTAAEANAIPVAEFTVAAVLFAGKRVPTIAAAYRELRTTALPSVGERSNYRRTVGIVGFSRIGRRVVDLLGSYDLELLVADPYADAVEVTRRGATLVDLDHLVAASDVVTIHAPQLPSTRHMFDAGRLGRMRDGATLINTARGSLVDTAALEVECGSGRLSAYLDVTEPEPLDADSPLWDLPNVVLTPHVAGSSDGEVARLADLALDEVERIGRGDPVRYPVAAEDLARMA